MGLTEVAAGTWRLESMVGPRNVYQYVIADGGQALIVDTGMTATPREVILPALRTVGIAPGEVAMVLVTHPDLDHQGGLAGLREVLPNAVAACGFADRMMVSEPERLVTDRYGAYELEHDVGYGPADKAWMRANYGAPATVEVGFAGGESVNVGERRLDVHHAPGHSPGHLVLHEPGPGLLFTSDAVHWRMCPAADGSPALPPTYEDVDPYLETIEMVESLGATAVHSGHWPAQARRRDHRVPGREQGLRRPHGLGHRRAARPAGDAGRPVPARRGAGRAVRRRSRQPVVRRPRPRPADAPHRPRPDRARRRAPAQVRPRMKVTAIDTVVVHAEMRNWVFVKVSTDEGLVGWGEATVEWKTRAVVGCVEDYRTLLLGEDPRRVEHLWQMMYRQHFFRPGMVECSAMSGIEHACWDITGKALGVPVYQLLGGAVRDTVRLYDHLGGGEMHSVYHALTPEQARERARESVALGFDAIKLEVVIPRTGRLDGTAALHHADAVMAAVRDEVGDGVELMVDMHGRCSPMMAAQYIPVLEPYRPWFFEEPCPPEHPRAMAELARRTTVPFATGERLCTRHPFRRAARARRLLGAAARRRALRRDLGAAPDRGDGRGLPRRARAALLDGADRARRVDARRVRHAELHHPGDVARRRAVALRRALPDAAVRGRHGPAADGARPGRRGRRARGRQAPVPAGAAHALLPPRRLRRRLVGSGPGSDPERKRLTHL